MKTGARGEINNTNEHGRAKNTTIKPKLT